MISILASWARTGATFQQIVSNAKSVDIHRQLQSFYSNVGKKSAANTSSVMNVMAAGIEIG